MGIGPTCDDCPAEGPACDENASSRNAGDCMVVLDVVPDGALAAWNKQCVGDFAGMGLARLKAIVPGDRILRINGSWAFPEMHCECKANQLLKVFVCRGVVDCEYLRKWLDAQSAPSSPVPRASPLPAATWAGLATNVHVL